MIQKKNISLIAAILINVNIIIGAGVFLNVQPLTKIAGPLGFAGYLLGAALLLPFVYSLAKLASANPVSGGLYIYSKKYLSPFLGFLSGWVYFIGKTVSAAFLAHAFTTFFQKNLIFLQPYPPFLLTSLVIFSLIFLNVAGAHIGGKIQYLFFAAKMLPIFFGIIFGLTTMQSSTTFSVGDAIKHIVSTVPIALYALMGFEITCSIGHMIKNPKKNIFWTIILSFGFITTIYTLFQISLFWSLGSGALGNGEPLAILANKVFSSPIVGRIVVSLVFTSVIASSFGILASNCWNLHALARDGHIPGKALFAQVSTANIPLASIVFQGIITCILLLISENQIALQSMSVFGVVVSFVLSALAAYKARNQIGLARWVPIISIASCLYILFLCIGKMAEAGVSVPYLVLIFGGILAKVLQYNN